MEITHCVKLTRETDLIERLENRAWGTLKCLC